MNANKLAEELENIYWIQGDGKGKPFQHYANFVRQQQEQIDKLTAIVALRELKIERMIEKQSHYEAMAHASGFEAGLKSVTKVNHEFNSSQLKELTDEEILDTFDPHFDTDIEDKELIKFAKAILRKAQEK